jgi:hypothetical protein
MSDLEKAFKALKEKQSRILLRNQYYDGDQPLVYSSERLRDVFGSVFARFNMNWCSVVVDSTMDRIVLKGFDVVNSNKEVDDELDSIWSKYHLQLDAEEVHQDALITCESYVIAWKRSDGTLDIYPNKSSMCHIFYDPDYPKQKKFAAKWFIGSDEKWHITLYYTDRLEYYVSSGKELPESASGFKTGKKSAENPFKEIPVFHFRCPGELEDILTVQDALNKLFADMMVAGEFGSFKQRWAISNSDTTSLKNKPGEIWDLPAGDGIGQGTSVGEFEGEDLTKFMNAIDKLANYVAIKSRTPKHYLYDVGAGISGDALIAMEAPLVKKAEKRIQHFSVTWQELAAFLMRLGKREIAESNILPLWGRVKSEQPLAETQAISFGTSSGIPLVTMLRRHGWTKAEIDQMIKDQKEQKLANTSLAKEMLDKARIDQDQNNDPGSSANDGTPNG